MITSETCVDFSGPSFMRSPSRVQTRTVRPKRVYGKRKVDSARAVLENDRLKRESMDDGITKPEIDALMESLQEKLADITLEGEAPKTPKAKQFPRIAVEIRRGSAGGGFATMVHASIPRGDAVESREDEKGKPRGLVAPGHERKEDRKRAPKVQSSVTIHNYVKPILEEASSIKTVEDFDIWAKRADDMFQVEKIAEGSYGEVYQLRLRQDISKRALPKSKAVKMKAYDNGVFKILPLRAQSGTGSKKFTSIQEVVAEVQMLKLLDPIPGFARFRDVHVVQGRFPSSYQAAWTRYSQIRDDCYNPDPSKKSSYHDKQLWAILEMDDAGYELERFNCSSIFQIYDIFWGVALALARAEQFAAFEHRDLHLGNICIKSTREDGCLHRPPKPSSENSGIAGTGFGLSGIETTIIDYSLSRADLGMTETSVVQDVAWSNLDKKKLFDAIGRDDDEKVLRDTYRLMRAEVYRDQDCPRKAAWRWKEFSPRTNLIWLSFILTMLLSKGSTNGILPMPRQPLTPRTVNSAVNGSENRKLDAKLKPAEENDLPGLDFQLELLSRLQTVLDVLEDQYEDAEALSCVGDLIAFAIGSQWLDESHFLC
ncbi:protein kinase [Emydomyces testavorans]|uniref:non-specific serine/threonine protein kinase n=1 Tax=Emydomyces testavorans TaxID=2070801 RepID=A0AAF0DNT3_9EURO|nr:protein kinase [Emydomyces testavorans]